MGRSHGYCNWKLDGIFCPGQNFVEIAKLFVQARELLEQGTFTYDRAFLLDEQVRKLHPAKRGLDTGFYEFDRNKVK
jgi:collagenase-like PrtC family protease